MPNDYFRSYSDHSVYSVHLRGGEDPDTTLLFGTETEVEPAGGAYYAQVAATDVLPLINDIVGDNIYFKRDASLEGDGFEVISEPCSLAYHTYSMRWRHVFKTLIKCGFRSHDADNCGFHVHVGRAQLGDSITSAAVIQKLKIFIWRHWDDCVRFSRRRRSELSEWCARPRIDGSIWCDNLGLSMEEWADYVHNHVSDSNYHQGRYQAINCERYETVEFRLFKGTLKRDTYIATLQFVHELVRWAQRATWEEVRYCDFLTPFADTTFPELRAYLVTRGLLTPERLGSLRRQPDFGGVDGLSVTAVA